ncbi:hypothetical protein L3Q67_27025 [Saccharothrix sp. AJ9571]|nr:hypothetical protein L3Q67_27025 [Saccharothrix sp. AJ9571]
MADADAIDAEIARLKARRQRLLDVFLDAAGEIKDLQAEFRDKRDELTAEITMFTAKAEALRGENAVPSIPSIEAFKALTTVWSRADAGMVNEALRSAVGRIYVHRADVRRDGLTGRLHVIGLWADDPYQVK